MATEAIERALDLAVFQRELVDGTRAMLGVEISSPDLGHGAKGGTRDPPCVEEVVCE
jgi:hypothetical protein